MAMCIPVLQVLMLHVTCNAVDCPWPLEENVTLNEAIAMEKDQWTIVPQTFFRNKLFAVSSVYYGLLPMILPWACRPLPHGEVKICTWRVPMRWAIRAAASMLLLLTSFGYLMMALWYEYLDFHAYTSRRPDQGEHSSLLKGEVPAQSKNSSPASARATPAPPAAK